LLIKYPDFTILKITINASTFPILQQSTGAVQKAR